MSSTTGCVVVGGGPAGMVTALILARAGVEVTVLEKHADFLRDFRGDTVHPTTLELLDELGLFERFDALPHSTVDQLVLKRRNGGSVVMSDIGRLRVRFPYIAIAPQWDFLNLLADAGRDEPTFRLLMNAEFLNLIEEDGRVVGVRYRRTSGDQGSGDDDSGAPEPTEHELYAALTIAADGRWSQARAQADLPMVRHRVNVDVWWFRLNLDGSVGASVLPRSGNGRVFIAIPRRGYVQLAMIIPKGSDSRLRAEGVEPLRAAVAAALPELADAVAGLSLDDVKLLQVELNRLRRWYRDGLLCLGDAAHAMSPVGGVGINLAVQDGVAAATILAEPLRRRRVRVADLATVQRRRQSPTRFTQGVQRLLHRVIGPVVEKGGELAIPEPFAELLTRFPILSRIAARAVIVGLLPEHAPDFARRPPSTSTRPG